MADGPGMQAFLRLIAWMSPAFPVGAFSYSGGLEQAASDGAVSDAASLRDWLDGSIRHGSGWNDAVLVSASYEAAGDATRIGEIAALAEAMATGRERQMETMLQGEAFLAAARAWPSAATENLPARIAYPVAVGAVAGAHGTGREAAIAAYLHASVSNSVSVAIRCGIIGQRDGVATLAALEATVADCAARAAPSTLDDLGSATIRSDIAGLRHETLPTRLFRS